MTVTTNGQELEQRCNWCTCPVTGIDDKYHKHCRKMLERLKTRQRVKDKCFRCGHSKKEHTGKITSGHIIVSTSLCSHAKRGWWKKGSEPEYEDQCDCEVYL